MKMDLDKKDMISLVKGTAPNLLIMDNPLINKYGNFRASYGTWDWNYRAFDNLSEEELLEIYLTCKNSWK